MSYIGGSTVRKILAINLTLMLVLTFATVSAEINSTNEANPTATVIVGPEGDWVFDPQTLEIEPGDTVEFVWEDNGHNINVLEQPDGGDWEGVSDLQDEGYVHTHTFTAEGRYEYTCDPHPGMDGTIIVGEVEDEEDVPGFTFLIAMVAAISVAVIYRWKKR